MFNNLHVTKAMFCHLTEWAMGKVSRKMEVLAKNVSRKRLKSRKKSVCDQRALWNQLSLS